MKASMFQCRALDFKIHASSLMWPVGSLENPGRGLIVNRGPRVNALAKDSQWATDRYSFRRISLHIAVSFSSCVAWLLKLCKLFYGIHSCQKL